jgi:hypothetical protein
MSKPIDATGLANFMALRRLVEDGVQAVRGGSDAWHDFVATDKLGVRSREGFVTMNPLSDGRVQVILSQMRASGAKAANILVGKQTLDGLARGSRKSQETIARYTAMLLAGLRPQKA